MIVSDDIQKYLQLRPAQMLQPAVINDFIWHLEGVWHENTAHVFDRSLLLSGKAFDIGLLTRPFDDLGNARALYCIPKFFHRSRN